MISAAHRLHVDLVRLLGATERLLEAGEPSADGSWEHWPRFCQFITTLGSIQSQLQLTVAETSRGSSPAPAPSAEDLTGYDRRLETLRRSRDDLASAAAAAAAVAVAAASANRAAENEPPPPQQHQQRQHGAATAASQRDEAGGAGRGAVVMPKGPRTSSPTSTRSSSKKPGGGGGRGRGGGDVFGGRRDGGGGGGGGSGQEADEAQADQVAQEISSMAGRLKESSMAINQTLRTQTQVLEDTGDAATQNVDRVRRENVRVGERLRKKRAAMFASWCMMITVLVTFFATYALVILPFEKRRGPFVAASNSAFAQAAEQSHPVPSQVESSRQQQQPDGSGVGAEEIRQRSEQAYREAARQARSKQQAANADHRVARAEMEASRQRQAERRQASAKKRSTETNNTKDKQIDSAPKQQREGVEGERKPELPAGSCSAPPPSDDDAGAGAVAGSCSGPPPDDHAAAAAAASASAVGSCSAPPPPNGDADGSAGGSCSGVFPDDHAANDDAAVGSCSAPPLNGDTHTAALPAVGSCGAPPADSDNSGGGGDRDVSAEAAAAAAAETAKEHRRKAQLAYEERSRLETQRMETTNAGLRIVAEEKEKYRQRQAEEMMRKQAGRQGSAKRPESSLKVTEKEAQGEDALRARAVEGSPDTGLSATAATTTANDRPGAGGSGVAGDTGDHHAGSQEVGGDEEKIKLRDDNAEEGGKESGRREHPVAQGTAAAVSAGAAGEGVDATSSSVDPQEMGRRMAEEAKIAYEKNSRRAEEILMSQNAGLRIVAEEKDKYRQRQTQSIMEGARRRKQQEQQKQGGHQAELGDGRTPTNPELTAGGRKAADDSSSAPATGLEAVRMRLRESMAAKSGGGEGRRPEKSTGQERSGSKVSQVCHITEMTSIEQQALNYHGMRMPMRTHHARQVHTQLLQHKHHQRTPCTTSSERGGFAGPLADRAKLPSPSHDLSNDDDGETSSASEDSAASYAADAPVGYKRPAEPSASFRHPPSQRSRTTSSPLQQQPGWLPVSSGGTFETGTAASSPVRQQRQLPRLAALETILSSRSETQPELTHQQKQQQQQQQHRRSTPPSSYQQQPHHSQDFPLGQHAPTTRLVSRTNATVQLPSLLHGAKSSASSVGSSISGSTSSSPNCSPGRRSSSPTYGGRYELPPQACTQGTAARPSGGASVNVNQRWLVGTGNSNTDERRQVPRIDALRPNQSGPGTAALRVQPWHSSDAAAEAGAAGAVGPAAGTVSCWPKHAGEGRRGVLEQITALPYSRAQGAAAGYVREMDEERANAPWARRHGAGSAWPSQRHHVHQQQAVLTQTHQQHSSEVAPPSSRTPSPVSSHHGQERYSRPQQQQRYQHDNVLSRASPTFGSSTSTSSASTFCPQKASWTPPVLDVGGRPASAVSGSGETHAHRGKWDEEAQATASGSMGKQILQRYLTHLYPKASREVWSHDEEEVLWRAQKEYGNAWGYISSLLPGRSENAVKNHWYTQMRMFIGQRGNNSSSSKPCPPASARAASSKSAGGKAGGRHNKPKPEDDKFDASKQHRATPPGSPAVCENKPEVTAPSSPITHNTSEPTPSATAAVAKAEVFDVHEEKQARADAVAALGMLFSQGTTTTSGAASTAEDRRR
eukprot:g7466.t1